MVLFRFILCDWLTTHLAETTHAVGRGVSVPDEGIGDPVSGDGRAGRQRIIVDDKWTVAIDREQRLQEPQCNEATLGSKRSELWIGLDQARRLHLQLRGRHEFSSRGNAFWLRILLDLCRLNSARF